MYSNWAARRRVKIIAVLTAVVFVVFAIYILVGLYEPPSCSDGVQNQQELGIDCEGPCELLCPQTVAPLKVRWARSLEVSSNMWSAIAYVENPNIEGYVRDLQYVFTFYDRSGELLLERRGTTFATHEQILPIFEGRIDTGDTSPYRTVLQFVGGTPWVRVPSVYDVEVVEETLRNTQTKPTLTAQLINQEPRILNDVMVVAIVYDIDGNAIAASETYVETLPARGKRKITFSWPQRFAGVAERIEIIPRVPEQHER
jgi:hypothetical protein